LECLSDEIQAKQNERKQKSLDNLRQNAVDRVCEVTKSVGQPVNTAKEVARHANVGEQTASRVMTINKRIDAAIANNGTVAGQKPEELKRQLMNGDITVNKAYQELQREEKAKKKAAAMSAIFFRSISAKLHSVTIS
jgi:DNA-binding ferritin-like protein